MRMQKNKTKLKNHFTEDMILTILLRFPVKSLLRFKCISKRWHSIISEPQFAQSHLKLASEQQTFKRRLLFSKASHFESLDLEKPWFGDDSSLRNLTCLFKQQEESVMVIGSCNGLVCLALTLEESAKFYIWNPSTGFYWRIPDYPNFVSELGLNMLLDCGFGYVSSTDDYKLLVTAILDEDISMYLLIFSSRNNSWKSIENPPSGDFNYDKPAVLSNEAVHWIRDRYRADILAFDLANEDYRELSLPINEYTTSNEAHFLHLGVLPDGCLCVMCFAACNGSDWMDFWVMREYGVSESWAKFFKFEIGNTVLENEVDEDLFYPVYMDGGRVIADCTNTHFFPGPDTAVEIYDQLTRLDREEDGNDSVVVCSGQYSLKDVQSYVIIYVESLLVLNDHHQG